MKGGAWAGLSLLWGVFACGASEQARPHDGQAPTIQLTDEWMVGIAEGGGPYSFGSIIDLAVDPLGRLYVLDALAGQVRVFASDGRHVRSFAGPGEGPGELAGPSGMDWGPAGHLWILDVRANRFTVYDTVGAFVYDIPRPASGYSRPWLGGFDEDGLIDATFRLRDETSELVLVRLEPAGLATSPRLEPRDTFPLWRPQPERFTVYEVDVAGRRRGVSVAIPFTAGLSRALTPDGRLWSAHTSEYRLALHTLEGDTLRVVSREHERVPVSAAQLDSALAELGERTSPELSFDTERIPTVWPALATFFEDDSGRLWVRPIESSGHPFDLFDRSGAYLGRAERDPPVASDPRPVTRGDTVWAVIRDDIGVERILRARLERAVSGD